MSPGGSWRHLNPGKGGGRPADAGGCLAAAGARGHPKAHVDSRIFLVFQGPGKTSEAQELIAEVPLTGQSAKERKAERSKARLEGKARGTHVRALGPRRLNQPPPLCNRSGVKWGEAPAPCECAKWPGWLAKASPFVCKRVDSGILKDGTEFRLQGASSADVASTAASSAGGGTTSVAAYWRPGGKKMKEHRYHNVVVGSIYKVNLLRGSEATAEEVTVFEVNCQAFTANEVAHYVTSLDLNSGPYTKYRRDKAPNKLLQGVRALQRP